MIDKDMSASDFIKSMWYGKDMSAPPPTDSSKVLAESKQVLDGLQRVALQLGAMNQNDADMQRYLQRLRKEGSGR